MPTGRPRLIKITGIGCPTCGEIRSAQHAAALQGDMVKIQQATFVRDYHERQVHHA